MAYSNFYNARNDDDKTILKSSRNAKSSCLSIESALGRILVQWNELKFHFKITQRTEMLRILYELYKEEKNLFLPNVFLFNSLRSSKS